MFIRFKDIGKDYWCLRESLALHLNTLNPSSITVSFYVCC